MIDLRFPWETDTPPAPLLPAPPPPKPRGRRPGTTAGGTAAGWLYHHLTISGPPAVLADCAAAARGAGVIPWLLDLGMIEEDVFNLAVAQPAERRRLSVAGCRILARQFRDRVEARQAAAAARVGQSRACPFDLHALLPVPPAILRLGPADPAALAWLSAQWGTTDRLRQVAERVAGRPPTGEAVAGYGFFTAGDTPRAAIDRLGARWPALRFVLQPRPAG